MNHATVERPLSPPEYPPLEPQTDFERHCYELARMDRKDYAELTPVEIELATLAFYRSRIPLEPKDPAGWIRDAMASISDDDLLESMEFLYWSDLAMQAALAEHLKKAIFEMAHDPIHNEIVKWWEEANQ